LLAASIAPIPVHTLLCHIGPPAKFVMSPIGARALPPPTRFQITPR